MPSVPNSPVDPASRDKPRLTALAAPVRRWAQSKAQTLKTYRAGTFRQDLIAGLSVAVVSIPQALAYALIAEVPPEIGLYTLIFQCLVGALLTSQPQVSIGITNTQSLLVAAIATRFADPGDVSTYLSVVVALTFLKGVLQLGFAFLRIGGLVRYVSRSVIVGFTAGAGVLIAAGQASYFLGTPKAASQGAWPGLDGVSAWATGVGLVTLGVLLGCRWFSKRLPAPLIAMVVVGAAAAWFDMDLRMVPALPEGLPEFRWPWEGLSLPQLEALLAGALALSLLGMMETYAIAKELSQKQAQQPAGAMANHAPLYPSRVSANQELFGQGVTHLVTSFIGCIPGSGSFARSALNAYAGAQTFIASIINALIVLVAVLLFGQQTQLIPMPVIAAILFVAAYGLVDWRYFLKVYKSNRSDALTCIATFAATLIAPLVYAVFIGIILNIALYLRRARQIYITELVEDELDEDGITHFHERPLREHASNRAVLILQIEGNLFFASAEELQDRFDSVLHSETRAVILRMKRTHLVDATIMGEISQFARKMRADGRTVVLCGIRPRMLDRMAAYGLCQTLGEENIFAADDKPFESVRLAIKRANESVAEQQPSA